MRRPGVRIPLPPQIFAGVEAKTVKLGPMRPGKKTIKGETATTIRRELLLRRREDRERSVCIRAGAIPHRAVEAARTGEPLRELLAQTSTTTPCRARA